VTTILLARHGETDWNRDGRFQGWADPPLNETGRAQARALAEQLRGTPFDAVYASDLRRAHETAEIVAAPHGVPVLADEGLREIDAILGRGELRDYHLAHAARADLCRRLGRIDEARASYERALELAAQEPERRFLDRRLREL
jgi:broad specificity phosphatase PhoE